MGGNGAVEMKNILLCLLAHEKGNGVLQNRHFPLSIGMIGEFIKKNFANVEVKLFKRPSLLSEELNRAKPDIVMFGNYMWNEKLCLFFAQAIRSIYPDTLIVFGGPNFSLNVADNIQFLRANRFVDVIVEGDGEIPAEKIVRNFFDCQGDREKLKKTKIPNTMSLSADLDQLNYGEREDDRIGMGTVSLDEIPSPYLSGAMDVFFENGTIPLLESNRGCPYSCSYCQQGTKYFSKIRYYNHERIGAELAYIAQNATICYDMQVVEFADPNFGMYKNDTEVFKAIRQVQDKYDFPSEIWCSSGKAQPDLIVSNAKILKDKSIMIRAALQSTNKTTLKDISRKNLPIEALSKMASKDVDTYSDIMLGLPSETRQSYIDGILSVIDLGVDEFSMPQTIILKGTPMEKEDYIRKYDLRTKFRVIPECDGVYQVGNISSRVTETEKVIYSTSTLSFEDYLECRKFNLLVMIFHNTRLLKPIYVYLDHLGENRSAVLSNILSEIETEPGRFATLLENFAEDTVGELSDTDFNFGIGDDIEAITSNKIYKHLTSALFNYRDDVLRLIDLATSKIIEDDDVARALIRMVESSMMDDFCLSGNNKKTELPAALKSIMKGDVAISSYSTMQRDRISQLTKLYNNKSDMELNIAYHLRPINMIKTLRFV